ncbi:hypothetical protein ACIQXA_27005 [Streptomyces massasporeus]|uniref:hypothetical protein n=1 Tax=Streptomyces massasporeus TaxID=67324 RepID=UPI00382D0DD2
MDDEDRHEADGQPESGLHAERLTEHQRAPDRGDQGHQGPTPGERVLAVFDASRAWAEEFSPRGCSMVNAHVEIGDPAHPAHPIITGQKRWMLALFTDLASEIAPETADSTARTLMLLHEGALVAHGLGVFLDAIALAREQARALLA